jgi:hypothetical protein
MLAYGDELVKEDTVEVGFWGDIQGEEGCARGGKLNLAQ